MKSNRPRTIKKAALIFSTSFSLLMGILTAIPSQAVPATYYQVTYDANSSQYQTGATAGTVPGATSFISGSTVKVATNSGNLTRQGFVFNGWNTQSNGNGTTFAAGSGTFQISSDVKLYAKWFIPAAARLINAGGSIVHPSNPNNVSDPTGCSTASTHGLAADGTYVYYVPNSEWLCKVTMTGVLVSSTHLSSPVSSDQHAFAYAKGCLFYRPDMGSTGLMKCVDISDSSVTSVNLPAGKPLFAGGGWLAGNIITFPDGRVGAVSAPNQDLPTGIGAGQCPSGMHCAVLRLYSVANTGKKVVLTFSEDIVLADDQSNWPDDNHGIATDGTYLYQIRFGGQYKVFALRSGAPSYVVFNGGGSGPCGATSGYISGGLCSIDLPTSLTGDGNPPTENMNNATYITRNPISGEYLIGSWAGSKFYKSEPATPPAGPGTATQPVPSSAVAQVTTSSNGSRIAVTTIGGNVYTSADEGTTWKKESGSGSRFWASLASSSDGTKLVSSEVHSIGTPSSKNNLTSTCCSSAGDIFTSTDSGATWVDRASAGMKNWGPVASSSDGLKIVAAEVSGGIFRSADGGINWGSIAPAGGSRSWSSLCSNGDGSKLAASARGGSIWTSIDSGATWTERTGFGKASWVAVTCSSDFVRLAAVSSGGAVVTSSNSGANWTSQAGSTTAAGASPLWSAMASDVTGLNLVATVRGGYIYTSADGGVNWLPQTQAGSSSWNSVATYTDGSGMVHIAALALNGKGVVVFTATS
jgi:uncharacterized repeat protein (TIGR02543 family)